MKNCPFCGGTSGTLMTNPNGMTFMFCKTCHAEGPRKQTPRDAVNAWDYRFDAGEFPPSKSTSDQELRELGAKIMVDIGEMYVRLGKSIIEMHQKE